MKTEPKILQIISAPAGMMAVFYDEEEADKVSTCTVVCLALVEEGDHRYVRPLEFDRDHGVDPILDPVINHVGYFLPGQSPTMEEYKDLAPKIWARKNKRGSR